MNLTSFDLQVRTDVLIPDLRLLGETTVARGFLLPKSIQKIHGICPQISITGRGGTGRENESKEVGLIMKVCLMMTPCKSCLFIVKLHVQNAGNSA